MTGGNASLTCLHPPLGPCTYNLSLGDLTTVQALTPTSPLLFILATQGGPLAELPATTGPIL